MLGVLRFHGSGYKASHQEGTVNVDFHQTLEVDEAGICDWIKGSTRDLKYQMLANADRMQKLQCWSKTHSGTVDRIVNAAKCPNCMRDGILYRILDTDINLDRFGAEIRMACNCLNTCNRFFSGLNIEIGDDNATSTLFRKGITAGFSNAACWKALNFMDYTFQGVVLTSTRNERESLNFHLVKITMM